MSQTSTVESILHTVEQSAKRTAEALVDAAKKRQDEALAKEEKRLTEELSHVKKVRLEEIRTAGGKEICAAENKARAKLFYHRETIHKEIMEQAKARIIDFTQTPEYKTYLINAAKKVRLLLQGDCSVLNMRECDRQYAAEVSSHLGHSMTLHVDPNIRLGGFTIISTDGKHMADVTLDSRLQEQDRWFAEHSGLTIE